MWEMGGRSQIFKELHRNNFASVEHCELRNNRLYCTFLLCFCNLKHDFSLHLFRSPPWSQRSSRTWGWSSAEGTRTSTNCLGWSRKNNRMHTVCPTCVCTNKNTLSFKTPGGGKIKERKCNFSVGMHKECEKNMQKEKGRKKNQSRWHFWEIRCRSANYSIKEKFRKWRCISSQLELPSKTTANQQQLQICLPTPSPSSW